MVHTPTALLTVAPGPTQRFSREADLLTSHSAPGLNYSRNGRWREVYVDNLEVYCTSANSAPWLQNSDNRCSHSVAYLYLTCLCMKLLTLVPPRSNDAYGKN